MTNSAFTWKDQVNRRPMRLAVDDIAVVARHLSNVPGSNMTVDVSFRWNTNGTVRVQSAAQLLPVTADAMLTLRDVELRPLDPYLEPFLNVFLLGSKVGLDGQVQMRTGTNGRPQIAWHGDLRLDDFEAVDGVWAEDLVKWKFMQISGIDATLSPPAVTVKEVTLAEPYARVVVETNSLLNLLVALQPQATNRPAVAMKPAATLGDPIPRVKGGLGRRVGALLRGILAANTNAAGASLAPKLAVASMVISNAQVHFSDRSLQPPVNASIQELSGTITGISSEELKRADFRLSGKVARTGPIEMTGKINPLSKSAPTEVKLTLRDVDLHPASPYFAKFVGYRLNRGTLNLEVDCEVSERKLKAKNVLVLDHFTLGQKVPSPDATTLPVRLAVAVLQDQQKWASLGQAGQRNLNPEQLTLTSEERNECLLKAYASLSQANAGTNAADGKAAPAKPATAQPVTRRGAAPEKGASALGPGVKSPPPAIAANEMETAVLRTIAVSDEELRHLAQERVRRVQQAILESGKIESERVLVADSPDAASTNRASRVYFHLR